MTNETRNVKRLRIRTRMLTCNTLINAGDLSSAANLHIGNPAYATNFIYILRPFLCKHFESRNFAFLLIRSFAKYTKFYFYCIYSQRDIFLINEC